jgi:hypothetical protein
MRESFGYCGSVGPPWRLETAVEGAIDPLVPIVMTLQCGSRPAAGRVKTITEIAILTASLQPLNGAVRAPLTMKVTPLVGLAGVAVGGTGWRDDLKGCVSLAADLIRIKAGGVQRHHR